MDTKHIKISDYNYDLPDERIAKFPISQRDHSKLLVYKHGEVSDDVFFHLPDYLPKGAMMVFNNTKVIQARMHFRKETGALIEVFLMEPAAPTDYELMFQTSGHCSWLCMIGNLKKWKEGSLKRDFEIKGHQLTLSATMRRGDALSVEASEMVARWWHQLLGGFRLGQRACFLCRDSRGSGRVAYPSLSEPQDRRK